jgi:hypothetical protein
MQKECIICRTLKSNFNEEHIFPKTIGGGFKIYSVCSDCNKSMGDKIDTPFVNLKQILLFRHNYGLQRANRNIKNPFHGKHTTEEGNTVIIQNHGDGFYYDFIPQMQIIETENGPVGKLTLSEKFVKSEEDVIKKYSQEFENRTGQPVGFHKVEKNTSSKPITITVTDSNNDFILGCLKIAYEAAVTCIPKYYTDDLAIVYSKMLEIGKINREYKEYINPPTFPLEEIISKLNKDSAINSFHCAVVISNIETMGLTAIIKIFDMVHCLILSKESIYLDNRVILFLNDSIQETLICSILKHISTFQLEFNTNSFTDNHWLELKQNEPNVGKLFMDAREQIPVYNEKKEMILQHLSPLQSLGNWNTDYGSLSTIAKYNLMLPNGLFLKSTKSNLLYELSVIDFNY